MAKKSYDNLLKLVLIGDSNVGKVDLLVSFTNDVVNGSFQQKIGVDFIIKTVELEGKKIKLQIWDTAGQERFHTITTTYYRGVGGVMLVYDVTNRRTFDNILKWLRNINEHTDETVVKMLVGNKCHLEEQRQVPRELGEELAGKHEMLFIETSTENNFNVDKAFLDLARAILTKMPSKEMEGVSEPVDLQQSETGASSNSKCF